MENSILDCGHPESPHGSHTTGYGVDKDGKKHCYACCAKRDRQDMIATGKACLYLVHTSANQPQARITNWPGSLEFRPYHVKTGRHNMAGKRYDAWFTGPDGKPWHGVTYGDMTQICHCRRVKAA